MKKCLLSLLAAIIAVGTAMAADQVFTWKYGTTTKVTGTKTKTGVITLPGTIAEAGATTTTTKDVTFAFAADKDCKVEKSGSAPKGIALGGKVSNKAYFADLVSLTTADFKGQLIKGISFTQKFNNASLSNKIIIKIDGTQVYEIAGTTTASAVKYENADGVLCNENITIEYHFPENNSTVIGYFSEPLSITYSEKTGPVDVTPNFKDYTTTFIPGSDQYVVVEVIEPADFIDKAGVLNYSTQNTEALEVNDELKKIKILKPVTDATVTVGWNASDNYNAGNATFKVTVDKAPAGLSFAAATDELFTDDETPVLVELINPNNLEVSYSSSDENVAAVVDGELVLGVAGVATITAKTEGNEIYAAGMASYTLTVVQAGLPGTPTFSFENDGYYKINESLVITPAAEGDEIYYKIGSGEYKPYNAPISFDAAEVYTVSAYAKNDKGQSTPTEISFLIEMLEYTGKFKDVEGELVLGDTRELEVELEGAKIADFNVTFTPEAGILLPIPATQNKYYIVGAGDVTFTAKAKVDAELYDGAITKKYTVKPKMEKSEGDATLVFDFSDVTNIGYTTADFTLDNNSNALVFNDGTDPELGGIDRTVDRGDGVVISFKKNSGQNNVRIMESANKLVVYADQAEARNGSSFIVNGKNITKIELLEDATSYNGKFTTAVGTMGNLNTTTKVYTWTCETPVPSVEFVNKTNKQIRIHTITVYCTAVTEVAKEFKPYELTLAGSDYEIGEAMPQAVLPDGCSAPVTYLVDDVEEPAYATKHFSDASVKIVAHTPGFGDYLPSVSEAFNITPLPINLPNQLTIHYSQGDGINMEGFKTVAGENGVYVFENIPVIGYDARLADKNYGHVFFSFYNVESTPAAAPRRAAAETDWSEVNNVVTYTPAEHRTVSGLNDEIELVRNKANTINGLPNVLCVPSAHETGKDVTFTVELKDDGTPSKVKLAEGTQTGVESVGVDADGEAEYYTLQGVRVAKPAAGIYLRRQGGTVSKVLVK